MSIWHGTNDDVARREILRHSPEGNITRNSKKSINSKNMFDVMYLRTHTFTYLH